MTVYIEEEYGYRYWKAEVEMSESNLANTWSNRTSITDHVRSIFPNAVQINQKFMKKKGVVYAHMHTDYDSFLKLSDNQIIYHIGYIKE
jgi:hypothetical protein